MDEYDRYQFDVSVQPFTKWLEARLRRNLRDAIDHMAKRLIADKRVPRTGSLGRYRGYVSIYYKADLATFETAWTEMRTDHFESKD